MTPKNRFAALQVSALVLGFGTSATLSVTTEAGTDKK